MNIPRSREVLLKWNALPFKIQDSIGPLYQMWIEAICIYRPSNLGQHEKKRLYHYWNFSSMVEGGNLLDQKGYCTLYIKICRSLYLTLSIQVPVAKFELFKIAICKGLKKQKILCYDIADVKYVGKRFSCKTAWG